MIEGVGPRLGPKLKCCQKCMNIVVVRLGAIAVTK